MLLVVAVSLLNGALVLLIPCEGIRSRMALYVGALVTQWTTLYHAGALNWMTFLVVWTVSAVGLIGFAMMVQWVEDSVWSKQPEETQSNHVELQKHTRKKIRW